MTDFHQAEVQHHHQQHRPPPTSVTGASPYFFSKGDGTDDEGGERLSQISDNSSKRSVPSNTMSLSSSRASYNNHHHQPQLPMDSCASSIDTTSTKGSKKNRKDKTQPNKDRDRSSSNFRTGKDNSNDDDDENDNGQVNQQQQQQQQPHQTPSSKGKLFQGSGKNKSTSKKKKDNSSPKGSIFSRLFGSPKTTEKKKQRNSKGKYSQQDLPPSTGVTGSMEPATAAVMAAESLCVPPPNTPSSTSPALNAPPSPFGPVRTLKLLPDLPPESPTPTTTIFNDSLLRRTVDWTAADSDDDGKNNNKMDNDDQATDDAGTGTTSVSTKTTMGGPGGEGDATTTATRAQNQNEEDCSSSTGEKVHRLNNNGSQTTALELPILGQSATSPNSNDDIFLPNITSQSSSFSADDPHQQEQEAEDDDLLLDDILGGDDQDSTLGPDDTITMTTPTTNKAEGGSGGAAMNSPGMTIPTPHWNKHHPEDPTSRALVFPHPLPSSTIEDTPSGKSVYYDLEDVDGRNTSFLPAGFPTTAAASSSSPNRSGEYYTWDQVQRYMHEAEERIREQLQEETEQTLKEFQQQAEQALQEHGVQWKADSEAEYQQMKELLREEQYKTQQKEVSLFHKTTALEEMKLQVEQVTREQRSYVSKIAQLEETLQKSQQQNEEETVTVQRLQEEKEQAELLVEQLQAEVQQSNANGSIRSGSPGSDFVELQRMHQEELRAMQTGKDEALKQVEELHGQLQFVMQDANPNLREEHIIVKAEKEMAERKILELQEQLDSLIAIRKSNSYNTTSEVSAGSSGSQQLQQAHAEIESLERQPGALKTSSALAAAAGGSFLEEEEYSAVGLLDRCRELQAQYVEAQEEITTLQDQLRDVSRLDESNFSRSRELEEEVQQAKEDRDTLLEQVSVLQEQYSIDAENAGREANELVQNLQEELTSLRRLRDADRAEQQQQLAQLEQERDLQNAKWEELRQQHTKELEEARDENDQRGKLDKELETLRRQLEEDRQAQESRTLELQAERDALQMQWDQGREELELQLSELQGKLELEQKASEEVLQEVSRNASSERDELRSQLAMMQQKYGEEREKEMNAIVARLEQELQDEKDRIQSLQGIFDEEKEQLIANHETKASALQGELDQLKEAHQVELQMAHDRHVEKQTKLQERIDAMQKQFQEDMAHVGRQSEEQVESATRLLQANLDEEHRKFEREKFELLESNEKECDQLRVEMVQLREHYDAKVEDTKRQAKEAAQQEIVDVKQQLETLRQEFRIIDSKAAEQAAMQSEREKYILELQEMHKEELEEAKKKSQEETKLLQRKFDEFATLTEKERKELSTKLQELESQNRAIHEAHVVELEKADYAARSSMEKEIQELEDRLASLQSGSGDREADRLNFERQLREMREEHGKEVEEMLAQLDEVEAEHNARYKKKERTVIENEAVISALGSQLADAQKRLDDMDDRFDDLTLELDVVQEEAKRAKAEVENRTAELERLQQSHQKAMAAQLSLREEACEAAREEMIERAEVQFEQANATYKSLKHEYDTAKERIASLERDLAAASALAVEAKNIQASKEVDWADELAQVKASMATVEASATRKLREYRHELERSKEVERETRRQCDEALATSRSVQSTLAAVVTEKEKLIKENQDLTKVCEELMNELEGAQQNSSS